jgi:hypothetical protein
MGWIGETYSARISLSIGGVAAMLAAGYGWLRLATRDHTDTAISETSRPEPAAASA